MIREMKAAIKSVVSSQRSQWAIGAYSCGEALRHCVIHRIIPSGEAGSWDIYIPNAKVTG